MPLTVPSLSNPRALAGVAMAGICTGLALGGAVALGTRGAGAGGPGASIPAGAIRQAFESTAPALRPRSTPSFSWAFLLPRPPLRLAATGHDLGCLTDAVYYEARGEPVEGQEAVAQVVLNRTRKPGFPKSVCGVVFQRAGRACQFSFACNGSITARRDAAAWSRAQRVATRALGGYQLAEIGGATHFHVVGLQVDWGGGLLQVARIGAHVFYGFGHPRGVSARSAAQPVLTSAVLKLPTEVAAPKVETPAVVTPAPLAPLPSA